MTAPTAEVDPALTHPLSVAAPSTPPPAIPATALTLVAALTRVVAAAEVCSNKAPTPVLAETSACRRPTPAHPLRVAEPPASALATLVTAFGPIEAAETVHVGPVPGLVPGETSDCGRLDLIGVRPTRPSSECRMTAPTAEADPARTHPLTVAEPPVPVSAARVTNLGQVKADTGRHPGDRSRPDPVPELLAETSACRRPAHLMRVAEPSAPAVAALVTAQGLVAAAEVVRSGTAPGPRLAEPSASRSTPLRRERSMTAPTDEVHPTGAHPLRIAEPPTPVSATLVPDLGHVEAGHGCHPGDRSRLGSAPEPMPAETSACRHPAPAHPLRVADRSAPALSAMVSSFGRVEAAEVVQSGTVPGLVPAENSARRRLDPIGARPTRLSSEGSMSTRTTGVFCARAHLLQVAEPPAPARAMLVTALSPIEVVGSGTVPGPVLAAISARCRLDRCVRPTQLSWEGAMSAPTPEVRRVRTCVLQLAEPPASAMATLVTALGPVTAAGVVRPGAPPGPVPAATSARRRLDLVGELGVPGSGRRVA